MRAWGRTRRYGALAALAMAPLGAPAIALAAPGPALTVDAAADRAPISPDIYGANLAVPGAPAESIAAAVGITVDRWGGNLFEGYNWQLGAVNTAADYFFENIADCFYFRNAGDGCANSPEYPNFVNRVRARGGRPLIQLPMVGYVAKDAPVTHPFTCGFPATRYATQNSFDPFDANCGDGLTATMPPTPLASNPTDSGAAADHTFSGAWVADLVSRYGRADAGGVPLYELGNEPGLWPATHRHVHPSPTSYDELRDRTIAWAGAVRGADPSAKILAFSEWAWPNYFCSPLDGAPNVACSPTVGAGNADRAAHGGKPLVNWLLEQVRLAGEAQGRRLIDYVDVHYYRQGGTTTDVTRSLWDPTYADPSWIADVIRLVPRMKEWVAQEFPGLGTAITEYNLSIAGQPVDNVLIQADVLGIFGRDGLDLATRYDVADDGTPDDTRRIYDAFRIYRNYDGAGGKFGDTRVRAASADQGALAIYGAQRSTDGALTLVLVNKSASELTSPLAVSGFTAAGPARAYQWTAAGGGVVPAGEVALGASATVRAKSITLLVAPAAPPAPGGGPGGGTGPGIAQPPGGKRASKRCKVPNVVGRKLADARRLLKKRGCRTGKLTRVASRRRKGRVVRQSVRAGRSVKAGTKVALRVSRGRRR